MDGSIEDSCIDANPAYPVADGRYAPGTPLSEFDGAPFAGTYTLTVSDNSEQTTGTVDSWALIATLGAAGAESAPDALAARLMVAPISTQGQISLRVAST